MGDDGPLTLAEMEASYKQMVAAFEKSTEDQTVLPDPGPGILFYVHPDKLEVTRELWLKWNGGG